MAGNVICPRTSASSPGTGYVQAGCHHGIIDGSGNLASLDLSAYASTDGSYLHAFANASAAYIATSGDGGGVWADVSAIARLDGILTLTGAPGRNTVATPAMIRIFPFLHGSVGGGVSGATRNTNEGLGLGFLDLRTLNYQTYSEWDADFGIFHNVPFGGIHFDSGGPLDIPFSEFGANQTLAYALQLEARAQVNVLMGTETNITAFGLSSFENTAGIGAVQIFDSQGTDISQEFVVSDAAGTVYGSTLATPEPSTTVLFETGFGIILLLRRKRTARRRDTHRLATVSC